MRKILSVLLTVFAVSTAAYADISIKLPAEFLNDVAKNVEFKSGKSLIQRILINQVLKNSTINGIKLKDFSAENLLDYFNVDDLFKKIGKNKVIEPNTGATLEFNSDGKCEEDKCTITVDLNGDKGPNEIWTKSSDPKDRLIFIIKQDKNKDLSIIIPEMTD